MNNQTNNYISIDVIANKIYKNPLLKDINFEDIIDYTLSVIKIAKVPGVYAEESCYKDIIDHKASLPKNALNLKTVDYCQGNRLTPMVMATDTLNNQLHKINSNQRYSSTLATYSVNNTILHTSFKEGKVFITFDTIRVDDDLIPMIPDSEALLRAIEGYIKTQVYSVLVDLGKVSERALNRAEQEYLWYIGKYQSENQGFKNEDDMESFLRGWKRMFIDDNQHSNRYSTEAHKERLRNL